MAQASYENINFMPSFIATADLSASQFCFVKIDTNGQIVIGTSASQCIGVLQDKPKAGDPGAVAVRGNVTKVLCGGTITAGQYVSCDGSGHAVAATSGLSNLGIALTAGANGSMAVIFFDPTGFVTP